MAESSPRPRGRTWGELPEWPLWPDLQPLLDAWLALQTQWRTGWGGATGLDYAGVRAWMDLQGLAPRRRRALFADLQVMERAALAVWRERAEREQARQRPG